ncbi:hypothetical protein ACWDTI_04690 [Gordonia sp. NPDC003424]
MRWSRGSRVLTVVAFASVAAGMVTPSASPATVIAPRPVASSPAAPRPAPPPGALVTAFVANQFTYCSLICPHMLDFVVQVPIALVQSPGVYVAARTQGQSPDRATGIAARSVTKPANSAMTGIIGNDVNLVLPRAQNALEVGVVGLLDVADTARAGRGPVAVQQSFDTTRADVLDALHAPIVPNPPDIAVPRTPAQAAALDVIDRGSAVLFQAPEMLMAGATESADVAAQKLAATGDMNAAGAAGLARFTGFLNQAGQVVERANSRHHVPVPLSRGSAGATVTR